MGKNAMIPASFDPITKGHEDLIIQAAGLFDKVYVVVLSNTEKKIKKAGAFSGMERLMLVRKTIDNLRESCGINNVFAELWPSLTAEFARKNDVTYIVKGARSASDFDYENMLAHIMSHFDNELKTIIIPAKQEHSHISSTYVRDLLYYDCPLKDAVPSGTEELMKQLYRKD